MSNVVAISAGAVLSADSMSVRYRADAVVPPEFGLNGAYLEHVWTPIIGPSSTLMLRRFGARLGAPSKRRTVLIEIAALADELGLGYRGGKNSPVLRTLTRLARFGFLRIDADAVFVEAIVRPVNASQVAELPEWAATAHRALVTR